MDAEVLDQIFEPFFTTKEQGKGTGLGLSTVYGIVQQNKGAVHVYSETGQGTSFKIYFPVNESAAGEKIEIDYTDEQLAGNESILLVEDVEGLRNLAASTISDEGYQVVSAATGEEAVKIFSSNSAKFDLLVTDVIMPGMNGKKLAETLNKEEPGLKVLFMSGYTDDTIMHHGILDENISFIQKPFTPKLLLRKIRTVLDDKE